MEEIIELIFRILIPIIFVIIAILSGLKQKKKTRLPRSEEDKVEKPEKTIEKAIEEILGIEGILTEEKEEPAVSFEPVEVKPAISEREEKRLPVQPEFVSSAVSYSPLIKSIQEEKIEKLSISKDSIRQGIIYYTILGPPKAFQILRKKRI